LFLSVGFAFYLIFIVSQLGDIGNDSPGFVGEGNGDAEHPPSVSALRVVTSPALEMILEKDDSKGSCNSDCGRGRLCARQPIPVVPAHA
jgi:hypothetical protein